MRFGRGREQAAQEQRAQDSRFAHELTHAAHKRLTGRIAVSAQAAGASAFVYLFEGDVYAVEIAGFEPAIGQRLCSGDRLTKAQFAGVTAVGTPADGGRIAAAEGWVSVDVVGTAHQEFTLATIGALLHAPDLQCRFERGPVTQTCCTVPIPVSAVLQAEEVRRDRLAADWARIPSAAGPAETVLISTGASVPSTLSLPEFTSLLAAVDGVRSLDQVAWSCGFTRAEAVHLAALLTLAGCLEVADRTPVRTGEPDLLVPEALGEVRLQQVPVAQEPMVEVVVPAEDDAPGAVDVMVDDAPDAVPAPDPVIIRVLEPVVEVTPEPIVAVPDDEPLVDGVDEPSTDYAIAALQGELAAAEHWARELRQRIERAKSRSAETHG